MQGALDEAGMQPEELSCIFTNANGSVGGDAAEARAIASLYSGSAAPLVVALKALVGELNSASGAMQACACALALHHGLIPSVLVPDEVDPCCALPRPEGPASRTLRSGLINAFSRTPGCGASSSMVLRAI
jgi:3-oxoacyl-(acyl-carrier-protein) synthase